MATVNYAKARAKFDESIQELAGSPQRSLLRELATFQQPVKELYGDEAFLDAVDAKNSDAAERAATSTYKTRENYESIATPALSDWHAIHTPHMDVAEEKTQVVPNYIRWGHTWMKHDKMWKGISSQSTDMRAGMSKIWFQQDAQILAGLSAATVTRVVSGAAGSSTTSTVTFSAVNGGSQVFNTLQNDYVSIEDAGLIASKFETQYVSGPIFAIISPTTKRLMKANNPELYDTDFVNSHRFFHKNELPDVDGISFVSHPQMPDDKVYIFSPGGIQLGMWEPLGTDLGQDPGQNFATIGLIQEQCDVKRRDDLKCAIMTITSS